MKNGRQYSMLGNVNAYMLDMGTWMKGIKWEILF